MINKYLKISVLILMFPQSIYSLQQLTIDIMISTWCQNFYKKLDHHEKHIMRNFIRQRANALEKAEMELVDPARQFVKKAPLKNFFQSYGLYYTILRLPDTLKVILSRKIPTLSSYSDFFQHAYRQLIIFENYIINPSSFSLLLLFDQIEDYYIETWYFLIECASCH